MGSQKEKTIAVLCNYRLDPNRIGGMDYFFWAFDQACKDCGHQVTWFFPNLGDHGDYPKMHIIPADEKSIEKSFLDTLNISKKEYDTVITHFLESCTRFYKDIKKRTEAKVIAVDHNPRPSKGYTKKKQLKKIIFGFLYSGFIDVFIPVSEQTAKDLINDFIFINKSKIKIIFNGLPVEKIKAKVNSSKDKLSFVVSSHLRVEKGIKDLVLAFSFLPKELRDEAEIDIYGDGPQREELSELISKLNLSSAINLKGSVRNIHEVYSNYDYLIHPSHAETFCYSVVEALLANLPVITTHDAGNILHLVKNNHNGFLFPIGNVESLSSIIQGLIEKGVKLHINERSYLAKIFSTDRMVVEYLKLL